MKNGRIVWGVASLAAALLLSACAGAGNDEAAPKENNATQEENTHDAGHGEMNHSGSGDIPAGLEEAKQPAYPVGSKVIIHADHMPGMNGAEATVSGAFDTTVYTVTYTPTTGGPPVKNHKWVIHEEIENAGDEPFQPGDEVVLNADHMKGMKGAKAVIDSAQPTTVYMVDYTDTETGEQVTNHKWVTEDELSPVK
ncbi:YdhK family protein [Geobacillus subterraneus]|uniref:YdhK family protein n=1 Tax=Geobacillus subterraneus TaxID=129338 RepID=UPI00161066D1